ncbi:MAG: hypothetical protein BWZ03_00235 [bacterium ADurb.BinA186]|nr:MAG: hypothetical protein BWZ03_00235 [bacterium ADurb.BinA186]
MLDHWDWTSQEQNKSATLKTFETLVDLQEKIKLSHLLQVLSQ